MRASRYFLQARQKASAGAQPPFHCMRGKGSLARTPQSKQVTPVWSGTHNSFYDSKKSRHETKTLINICRTSELLCCQTRDKSWRRTFSSLEVFWAPASEKQNFCSPAQQPQPKNGHQWGRTCRSLSAPYPHQVCVPTPLAGPNKTTFTGYFPSRTPRAQASFGTDLLGLSPEQSTLLESIKRSRAGFFPIIANEIVWVFFLFIRQRLSWHKFPHCCSWPASVLNNSGLVIFASQTHFKKYRVMQNPFHTVWERLEAWH